MIKTKRIYEPADPTDGHRLLIMRRWPRGIKKTAVDSWEPDLGPSLPLLTDYRKGKIDWPALAKRYRQEMAGRPEALAKAAALAKAGDVTLLCSCHDEAQCHRTLLKEMLEGGPSRS
jgi:uncharacterized protein YeaO (DUF488 family)